MTEDNLVIRCIGNKRMLSLRFKSHCDIQKGEIIDIALPIEKIREKIKEKCL